MFVTIIYLLKNGLNQINIIIFAISLIDVMFMLLNVILWYYNIKLNVHQGSVSLNQSLRFPFKQPSGYKPIEL